MMLAFVVRQRASEFLASSNTPFHQCRGDATPAMQGALMDFKRAQTAARALEVKSRLETSESAQAERSTRG